MPGMTSLFAAVARHSTRQVSLVRGAHLLPGFGLLSKYGARFVMPAGERVRSFTIVTTVPNELRAELHNRMPVILKPQCGHYGSVKRRPACRSSTRCSRLTRRTK